MASDRNELKMAVMAEMRPLCEGSRGWHGWPGTSLFAEVALTALEREGVNLSAARRPPEPAPTGDTADVVRKRMAALIANDAYAATFQSLSQYRTALLRSLVTD